MITLFFHVITILNLASLCIFSSFYYQVLCIHLKRFRHEFMYSSKIGSYVSFPLEGLDMTPYLHRDCTDTVTVYDLVSVICHHGTSGGKTLYTCSSFRNKILQMICCYKWLCSLINYTKFMNRLSNEMD